MSANQYEQKIKMYEEQNCKYKMYSVMKCPVIKRHYKQHGHKYYIKCVYSYM